MRLKTRTLFTLAAALGLAVILAGPAPAGENQPCPWRISKIEVAKWGNGNLKASLWAHGSFPIPPGVSERPTWYVNGRNVGHSQIFFNTRRLPNAVRHLQDKAQNTVEVKFLKPPYNGASNSYSFYYDSDQIRPGQHKIF